MEVCPDHESCAAERWNEITVVERAAIVDNFEKRVRACIKAYSGHIEELLRGVDRFQARFPGLYGVYSESPERRRINALLAIAITTLVVTCVHLCLTIILLIGAIKRYANCIWPWLISCGLVIGLSTAYAVIWWSGDVFGEQLAMSVAEFVLSLAANGVCLAVVAFFFMRLRGVLTSVRPKEKKGRHGRPEKMPPGVPEWRQEWDEQPPKMLAKKLRKSGRSKSPRSSMRRGAEKRLSGRCPRDSKFRRLSLSPEMPPTQPVQQQPNFYAPYPVQTFAPREAVHYTPGGRAKSNWLYLSQERLDAHNATMERQRRSQIKK